MPMKTRNSWLAAIPLGRLPRRLTWMWRHGTLGRVKQRCLPSPVITANILPYVDDRAARRCARVLDIPLLGTAGVVVLAKRRGLIASVGEALRFTRSWMWLSEQLIEKLAAEDKTA